MLTVLGFIPYPYVVFTLVNIGLIAAFALLRSRPSKSSKRKKKTRSSHDELVRCYFFIFVANTCILDNLILKSFLLIFSKVKLFFLRSILNCNSIEY